MFMTLKKTIEQFECQMVLIHGPYCGLEIVLCKRLDGFALSVLVILNHF